MHLAVCFAVQDLTLICELPQHMLNTPPFFVIDDTEITAVLTRSLSYSLLYPFISRPGRNISPRHAALFRLPRLKVTFAEVRWRDFD